MEQSFRIALWMFVLVGYLHAVPICIKPKHVFTVLRSLSCNETATFSSPPKVPGCYTARLEAFMKGMEHAKDNCTDDENLIDQAVEVMNDSLDSTPPEICNFTMTVHHQFESFVNVTVSFIEELNSQSCQRR